MARLREPRVDQGPKLIPCDWCEGTGAATDGCPFTRKNRVCRKCRGTGKIIEQLKGKAPSRD